jgi:hypothetical protein
MVTIVMLLFRGEFGLSNLQDGILSSAFLVGLLVASPIFAYLAKTYVLRARPLFWYIFVDAVNIFYHDSLS